MKIKFPIAILLAVLLFIPAVAQTSSEIPEGVNEDLNKFRKEPDLAKRELILAKIKEQFPPKNVNQDFYDYLNSSMAFDFIKSEQNDKYEQYVKDIAIKESLMYRISDLFLEWIQAGEKIDYCKNFAENYLKTTNPDIVDRNSPYAPMADVYAYILHKEGRHSEAKDYVINMIDLHRGGSMEFIKRQLNVLESGGYYKECQEVIEKNVLKSNYNQEMLDKLQYFYAKVNGNANGFDQYKEGLEQEAYNKIYSRVEDKISKEPEIAPSFTLYDLNGSAVSLEELRGKIVVLDFWATWCGPCKMSFPGMQMAVNNYKNDPEVVFLFIDTWERGKNPQEKVKEFIEDNGYTFHVLMDLDGTVAKQYEVRGIPAKFIIGKEGKIQFISGGYSGSDISVFNNMKAMVEALKN